MFSRILFEVGNGALALHLYARPFVGAVVYDGKLLLSPRCVVVNKVAVHHTVAVRVPFFEHGQARSPVGECPIGVGVGQGLGGAYLLQAVYILVGSAVRYGFCLQRIVVVVDVYVAEDEIVAGGEDERCGNCKHCDDGSRAPCGTVSLQICLIGVAWLVCFIHVFVSFLNCWVYPIG